jgi:predicted nucleic acid-binding Zn ribbon protein
MLPGTEPLRFTPPARYNFPSHDSLTPSESAASQELGNAMPRTQLGPAVRSTQYSHAHMAIADTPTFTPLDGSNVRDPAALNSVTPSANVKLSASIQQERSRSVCSHTCEILKQSKNNVLAVLLLWFVVPASLILGGLLPVLGSLLPATSVTHSGVVALVVVDLDKGPGMRTSSFSVLQLLLQVPDHLNVNPIGKYGVWAVTIVFGVGIIVVPVLQAVVWIIIWAFPLSLRSLQRLLKLSEALAGMSFFEIFIISFLVTVVQLETLIFGLMTTVRNGVGDSSFARTQNLVATLDGVGAINPTDATIFGLAADLQQGAYVLLLAVFLLRCGGIFVHSQALEIPELSSPSQTLQVPELSGSQGSVC